MPTKFVNKNFILLLKKQNCIESQIKVSTIPFASKLNLKQKDFDKLRYNINDDM